MENKTQLLNERFSVYRQILNNPIRYYTLNQKQNFKNQNVNMFKETHDFILDSS